MLFQGQVGALPGAKATGGNPNVLQGFAGELLKSDVFPPYYTLAKNNKVYYQVANAVNPTVFTGGAAGTPLIGLYNPVGSGVDLIVLATRIAVRTTGTAAVTVVMLVETAAQTLYVQYATIWHMLTGTVVAGVIVWIAHAAANLGGDSKSPSMLQRLPMN